jgi:hypothetical protein
MTMLPIPSDPHLPLFAYGLLKPGELGYHKVADLVGDRRPASLAPAGLRLRDGLPLLVMGGDSRVDGWLLCPAPGSEEHFYTAVAQFEPASQYIRQGFTTVDLSVGGTRTRANLLRARTPDRGSEDLEGTSWSSATDPLLVEGLRVVRREAVRVLDQRQFATLCAPQPPRWELFEPLFQLQAIYLLLWTVAERVAAFAEGPDLDPVERLRALEQRDEYRDAFMRARVVPGREVIDSRHPSGGYLRLREDSSKSLSDYWYAVRSTIVHRGKAAFRDAELVALAIIGLHDVLRRLLLNLLPAIAETWARSEPAGAGHSWTLAPLLQSERAGTQSSSRDQVEELRTALMPYRQGRKRLLESLGCGVSNRDPLAEFSERLVTALLAGELAASRVQKGYDMVTQTGVRVQVRYLANPKDGWVNEHTVRFDKDVDRYALVVFEDLDLLVVLLFPRKPLPDICAALGSVILTKSASYSSHSATIGRCFSERHRFEQLGMSIILF